MSIIALMVAVGRNGEIGVDGRSPWGHNDVIHDRLLGLTKDSAVVVGRKTWDGLSGRPLPGRVKVVITRDARSVENAHVASRLTDGFRLARRLIGGEPDGNPPLWPDQGGPRIFVIGGASIFRAAWPFASELYLTCVDRSFPDADSFCPAWPIRTEGNREWVASPELPYDVDREPTMMCYERVLPRRDLRGNSRSWG